MGVFCSHWQSNELPFYAHDLDKGQSIQVAVAIVTSKGLHVSKRSNVSHHEGEWMTTLNGELLRPGSDAVLHMSRIEFEFRPTQINLDRLN